MKAICINETGKPDLLRYDNVPLPATPGLDAAEAQRLLAGRHTTGQLLLVP